MTLNKKLFSFIVLIFIYNTQLSYGRDFSNNGLNFTLKHKGNNLLPVPLNLKQKMFNAVAPKSKNSKILLADARIDLLKSELEREQKVVVRGEIRCADDGKISFCKKRALEEAKRLAIAKASEIAFGSVSGLNIGILTIEEISSQVKWTIREWEDLEKGWLGNSRRYHTIRAVVKGEVLKGFSRLMIRDENKAKTLAGLKTYKDKVADMAFIFIKGGCIEMGDRFGDGDFDEHPVHTVCVDDYYLGKHEVTLKQWKVFIKDTNYSGNGDNYWKCKDLGQPDYSQKDNHPMSCVSWREATAYVKWLSKKTGKKYSLPTEAQWEYAARSKGKDYKYSWGNGAPAGNISDESTKGKFVDWTEWEGYNDGYVYTAPVMSFKPNELGLFDMSGNVWEWCEEWYKVDYYRFSPRLNPKGPEDGTLKALRGGSWYSTPPDVRTVARAAIKPKIRSGNIGFRLALN